MEGIVEFFQKWNKKPLDFDGAYGPQCVDVIKQYFQDVLGKKPFSGNAIDYWNTPPIGFEKISKTFYNHPEPGDIIIWNTSYNPYGHIGICNWWRWFDLSVFEQNNPIGSVCHYGTHNYKNVLGWLRPVSKQTIKMVYLSDTDDVSEQVKYCDTKLKEFTGGMLGIEYIFKQIPAITAPYNMDLDQWVASDIVSAQSYDKPFHWVVLAYYGYNTSPGYSTYTNVNDGKWMTQGYKTFSKETLLFELKHFCVKFYNQHRGTNPYIENYDNYKSADGGLAKVEEQIKQLIPYLAVFKI